MKAFRRRFNGLLVPELCDHVDYSKSIASNGSSRFAMSRKLADILLPQFVGKPVFIEHESSPWPLGTINKAFVKRNPRSGKDSLYIDYDVQDEMLYNLIKNGMHGISLQHYQDNLDLSKSRVIECSIVHKGARPGSVVYEAQENSDVTNNEHSGNIRASSNTPLSRGLIVCSQEVSLTMSEELNQTASLTPPAPEQQETEPMIDTENGGERNTRPERKAGQSDLEYIFELLTPGCYIPDKERLLMQRHLIEQGETLSLAKAEQEKTRVTKEQNDRKLMETLEELSKARGVQLSTILPLLRSQQTSSVKSQNELDLQRFRELVAASGTGNRVDPSSLMGAADGNSIETHIAPLAPYGVGGMAPPLSHAQSMGQLGNIMTPPVTSHPNPQHDIDRLRLEIRNKELELQLKQQQPTAAVAKQSKSARNKETMQELRQRLSVLQNQQGRGSEGRQLGRQQADDEEEEDDEFETAPVQKKNQKFKRGREEEEEDSSMNNNSQSSRPVMRTGGRSVTEPNSFVNGRQSYIRASAQEMFGGGSMTSQAMSDLLKDPVLQQNNANIDSKGWGNTGAPKFVFTDSNWDGFNKNTGAYGLSYRDNL